jgi:adenylate cyclase
MMPGPGTLVALSLLLAAIAIRIADPAPVENFRVKTFDLYQNLSPRPIGNHPVAIVDLDEKSLNEFGQWPWPRSLVAKLIDKLGAAGVLVVGFDTIFAEYDRLSPGEMAALLPTLDAEDRAALRKLPSNESIMAKSMGATKTVLGQAGLETPLPKGRAPTMIRSPVRAMAGGDPRPFLPSFASLLPNVPELEAAAAGHGIFSLGAERDGKVRRVPLLVSIGKEVWPTLAVEMLRAAYGDNTLITRRNAAGMESVQLQIRRELGSGNFIIPTDANGRIWVHFSKPDQYNTETNSGRLYVSAADVLEDRVPVERLSDKFVIIGTSAVGLKDLRDTPVLNRMPGVEIHANVLEQIFAAEANYTSAVQQRISELRENGAGKSEAARIAISEFNKEDFFLRYPNYSNSAEIFLTLLAGLVLIIAIPRWGPGGTLVVLAVASAVLIVIGGILYKYHLLLLDLTFPGTTMIGLYAVLAFNNYTRDAAEKKQVRSAFRQYLSPTLVEQLANNPERLQLGGQAKEMTFLFCDVRDFTSISETYKSDPQALTILINRLLTPLSEAILAHSGTIDKYMGDCVMAFWNAPVDVEDHERKACDAALDMLVALEHINRTRFAEAMDAGKDYIPLRVGIGLNTGECVVGNMGSAQRFDYSVLGDSVNLAARLEAYSSDYGVTIVLGEATAEKVKDHFALLELDQITVKGRSEASTIYGLIGDRSLLEDSAFNMLVNLNSRMLRAYRTQKWREAVLLAGQCAAMDHAPGGLYALYRDRIDEYQIEPPGDDWDGIFVATTKKARPTGLS